MQRCQNIVKHMYVQEVLGSSPSRTAYLMAPPVEHKFSKYYCGVE